MRRVEDPCCQLEVQRTKKEGPCTEDGNGPGFHCEGPIGDWVHNHVECVAIYPLWSWVRERCCTALDSRGMDDQDLLKLKFQPGGGAATATWLIGTYVQFIWEEGRRGTRMSLRNLLSFFHAAKLRMRGTSAERLVRFDSVGLG